MLAVDVIYSNDLPKHLCVDNMGCLASYQGRTDFFLPAGCAGSARYAPSLRFSDHERRRKQEVVLQDQSDRTCKFINPFLFMDRMLYLSYAQGLGLLSNSASSFNLKRFSMHLNQLSVQKAVQFTLYGLHSKPLEPWMHLDST